MEYANSRDLLHKCATPENNHFSGPHLNLSDFVLALFPIVLLWKVQIALRTKAGICILMGLGLLYVPYILHL